MILIMYSKCLGTSLLETTYKMLSNNLPSNLIAYVTEIVGGQCGIKHYRSNTDWKLCLLLF